ncbi:uncharacterized protein LOC131709694 [Acipenser ruthenus]|uniref:uncharacterized protein LOC131709694 n=1 Tax=Acipenser ruthenus TaxID=7906 RepID=UPI002740E4D5|nr:uncharacterized protein LOC131709694 [Acipenser ruthenus]
MAPLGQSEDSFEEGLYVVVAAVVILVAVILCSACRSDRDTKRLIRDDFELQQDQNSENKRLGKEKEDLQKQNESEKERLVKEKEDLQKQNETLKQEKEKVEADLKDLQRNTNTCGYALGRAWEKMTKARVNMTLDPDTASPSLTVSEDGSQVRFTGER